MERQLWWHAYKGDCGHVQVTLMFCESTMHPEALAARDLLSYDTETMCSEGCKTTALYVRSWDHEPDNEERERAGLDQDDDDVVWSPEIDELKDERGRVPYVEGWSIPAGNDRFA